MTSEYEARCELMGGAAAAAAPAPARPIPAVRVPGAATPLAPLCGPDEMPIDLHIAEVFHAKLAGALAAGYNAAQAREVATNTIVGLLNRSMVHVTQESCGVFYLVAKEGHYSLHAKKWKCVEEGQNSFAVLCHCGRSAPFASPRNMYACVAMTLASARYLYACVTI